MRRVGDLQVEDFVDLDVLGVVLDILHAERLIQLVQVIALVDDHALLPDPHLLLLKVGFTLAILIAVFGGLHLLCKLEDLHSDRILFLARVHLALQLRLRHFQVLSTLDLVEVQIKLCLDSWLLDRRLLD